MAWIKCDKCNIWHFDDRECPAVFSVFHIGQAGLESEASYELGHLIGARNFEHAAEQYALRYDTPVYHIIDGDPADVIVFDSEGQRKRFKVTGVLIHSYTTKEIKEGAADES